MSLLEELRADQDPRTQCRFCVWLETRTKTEQAEWAEACGDRAFTHASIFRAAQKRGYTNGKGSVESHRAGGHGK